ncbi:MAG TPA: response regulator [Puia sp.]|jgi:DNA-binding response OmpR family regulator|nr:response regulator [Puia sp.]
MAKEKNHILIIEDNEDILTMIEMMLVNQNYRVSKKADGDNLELMIKEIQPDIILMDMLLSGVDGTLVCKQVKENPSTQHIPIIMISALSHGREKSEEAGSDFFLAKPFEMDDLLTTTSAAFRIVHGTNK